MVFKGVFRAGLLAFIGLMMALPATAQDHLEGSASLVDKAIGLLEGAVFFTIPVFGQDLELIVIWMFAPMVFLTIWFKFINVRGLRLAFNILRGHYRDDTAPGEVTQFQALSTALSGTVGLGNIAGVAIAIALGGPGAAFWMLVIGFFAMSLKFAECTLGVKYRKIKADGTVSGGPMYYLKSGMAELGHKRLGPVLAVCYGIFGLFVIPQLTQVNQAYNGFAFFIENNFDSIDPTTLGFKWGFGIVMAALVAIVIIGGIKSVANVTVRLVPLMAAIYVGGAFFIIFSNLSELPAAIGTIVSDAFQPKAGIGAVIGAFVWGMRRAVYSTEAGWGTATIAHSAAKTHEPVSEGMVALLEPFIDTVIICSITALVIVITGAHKLNLDDIQMTAAAFNSVINGFDVVLAVAVLLFSYSTVVSWGYYCSKFWEFNFGSSPISTNIYRFVFIALIIPGPVFTPREVVAIMDSFYFLLAIPNIIGIYFMAPMLKREVANYLSRIKSGEIKRVDTAQTSPAE